MREKAFICKLGWIDVMYCNNYRVSKREKEWQRRKKE